VTNIRTCRRVTANSGVLFTCAGKVSGAMAAGVTEWLWRINDIVATLEEWENTQ
jgi:hypothetical protein